MNRLFLILCAAIVASSCATTAVDHVLPNLKYSGETKVADSQAVGRVHLIADVARGGRDTKAVPDGELLIPTAEGTVPALRFGVADQRAFIESLRNELLRLRVASELVSDTSLRTQSFDIQVIFVRTAHEPPGDSYLLHVVLEGKQGNRQMLRHLRINSSEGNTYLQRLGTALSGRGKERAGQRLMNSMLPILSKFIR